MLKNLKAYYRSETLKEALTLLNDEHNKNVIIGGGSFLAFSNDISIDGLIDIQKLGYDKINVNSNSISIDSGVSIRRIQRAKELSKFFNGAINKCASLYMNALQRNQSTIGGVIYTSFSNTDIIALLIGLSASIVYETKDGEKKITLKELYKENPQKVLKYSIIKTVNIEIKESNVYIQRISRTATDIPIITCILVKHKDNAKDLIFSSVDNLPICFQFDPKSSEENILNKINNDFNPITDIRGSAEYRKETAIALTKRLLKGETI